MRRTVSSSARGAGEQGRAQFAVDVGEDVAVLPAGGEDLTVDVEAVLADQGVGTSQDTGHVAAFGRPVA